MNHVEVVREMLRRKVPIDRSRVEPWNLTRTQLLAQFKGSEEVAEMINEYLQKKR